MPPFNKLSIKSESNKLVNVTNELGDKLDKLDWSWSLNLNTIIALIIMIKAEGKIKIKFSFLKNSLISKINLYKKIHQLLHTNTTNKTVYKNKQRMTNTKSHTQKKKVILDFQKHWAWRAFLRFS